MNVFLSLLLSLSLVFSQTVVVQIPGQRQEQTSSNGNGIGLLVGLVAGVVLGSFIVNLLFSKAVPAKTVETNAGRDKRTSAFIPFEFIVVHKEVLPKGIEIIESFTFDEINFSLLRWDKSQRDLEDVLDGKVLLVQPNYIYELFGEGNSEIHERKTSTIKRKAEVCLLDTGADLSVVSKFLIKVENQLRNPYNAEDHGTANTYIIGSRGAGVYLHRVCWEGRCTSFAFAKALVGCFKDSVKVINTPFGMYGEDKVAGLIISNLSKLGFTVVAPVGNEPSEILPFPARHPLVVKVAGEPCFPKGLCESFPREPYKVRSIGLGGIEKVFIGTSFSSALHALKLSISEPTPRN